MPSYQSLQMESHGGGPSEESMESYEEQQENMTNKVDDNDTPPQRRRSMIGWMLLLFVVVAGGLVGGLCGTGQCGVSSSEQRTSSSNHNNGTTQPPTPPPTMPFPESDRNDICPNAQGPLYIGTKHSASIVTTLSSPSCTTTNTKGSWFTVTGGGEVLRASTCESNTSMSSTSSSSSTISVFEGPCGQLQCVAYSDNNSICEKNRHASVSWWAKKGVLYFVKVEHDSNVDNNDDIVLRIAYEDNGSCNAPIGPLTPTALNSDNNNNDNDPSIIVGSMRGAIVNATSLFFTCDFGVARLGQVWYSVRGTGQYMKVRTCHDTVTNFEARVDVYPGTSCPPVNCVAPRDSDCGMFGSQMVWNSVKDELYYVSVSKSNRVGGNQFGLDVSTFTPASNSRCESAISIPNDGTMVQGSTELALLQDDPDGRLNCYSTLSHPGVWYVTEGTGEILLASTCHEETNFASEVYVYAAALDGTCDNLACEPSAIQYCKEKSSVFFQSVAGETYYILVHASGTGVFPNVGSFALTVQPFVTEPNDLCPYATELDPRSGRVTGSTFASTQSGTVVPCTNFQSKAPGVWYSVVGRGSGLRVSTCDPQTNFDTQITVYSGDCDNLRCENTDDNTCGLQSSVAWAANLGTRYFIYVHGRLESSVGDFALTIEEYTPMVDNDFCDDSVLAPTDGSLVLGTTVGATFDNAGTCVAPNTAPGVWYSLNGTGTLFIVSACADETDYNAAISVFEGDCVEMQCVTGSSDAATEECGLKPEVAFISKVNRTYHILLHGYDDREGNFGLTIDEPEPVVENDYCVHSTPIQPSPEVIKGTTLGATEDDTPWCSNILQEQPGVWYTVQGNGKRFIASTCNSGETIHTRFDTKLSIFTGSCGDFNCTNADDNFCGFQSRLVWLTEPNVTYHILVHGSATGDFGLVVDEFVPSTTNDFCSAAQGPILMFGETIAGSTVGASFDEAEECGVTNTSPGVWFFIVGTGDRLTADTCNPMTNFDTKVSVYTGSSCGDLKCVAGNDDGCGLQSSITWDSEAARKYWILVHGWSSYGIGSFGLTLWGSDFFN